MGFVQQGPSAQLRSMLQAGLILLFWSPTDGSLDTHYHTLHRHGPSHME